MAFERAVRALAAIGLQRDRSEIRSLFYVKMRIITLFFPPRRSPISVAPLPAMGRIRSVLATLLWASPASPVLLSGAARPLASCRVPAPACLADRVEDANAEDPEVTKARSLSRLQSQAVQWLAMSSAINLSEGEGLQPFAVPQGWMAAPSAPPAQAFSNDELIAEIERHEPALLALLEACAERAPSLCTPSAMLPLARLAAWTERDAWVRAPSGEAATPIWQELQPCVRATGCSRTGAGCNPSRTHPRCGRSTSGRARTPARASVGEAAAARA